MITLFIDTCHYNLIVGIYKDNEKLVLLNEKNDNHLSERLLPLIDKALKSVEVDVFDISHIVVANGPGSFTGVRIGVTVAKTLAYAIGCKIHTVSELQIMASSFVSTKYIVPLIDARRDAVYGAIYSSDLEYIIADTYLPLSVLIDRIQELDMINEVTFVSYETFDGIDTVIPKIDLSRIICYNIDNEGIACHLVNPNYLKRTEAEEKLGV